MLVIMIVGTSHFKENKKRKFHSLMEIGKEKEISYVMDKTLPLMKRPSHDFLV